MPGADHTKMMLAQSLQELMTTMPLEKISVNNIVEHAGMGRNTFYYHFEDKYDLVNWYFQTGMTHFLTSRIDHGNWQSILQNVEDYLRENRVFYINALSYSGQNSLRSYIFDFSRDMFIQRTRERLKETSDTMTPEELHFAGDFAAGAIMGILLYWVDHGMKEHIADYYRCLQKLLGGVIFSLPEKTEEDEDAPVPG